MEASPPYSKTKDPFRIRDRVYISLNFSDSKLQWQKGLGVSFNCHHTGQKPSSNIDVFLADHPKAIATLEHDLLARYLHTGTELRAEVINRPRNCLFNRRRTEPQTLKICIEPGELDWSQINPILQRNNDIALKIEEASFIALTNQTQALSIYEDAVNDIYDLHFESPLAHYWRRIQFPVNELTAIMEKMGAIESACETIAAYEAFDDQLGLLPIDEMELRSRKARLEMALMQTRHRQNESVPPRKSRADIPGVRQLKQRIAG